jgi:hypothetical protein
LQLFNLVAKSFLLSFLCLFHTHFMIKAANFASCFLGPQLEKINKPFNSL